MRRGLDSTGAGDGRRQAFMSRLSRSGGSGVAGGGTAIIEFSDCKDDQRMVPGGILIRTRRSKSEIPAYLDRLSKFTFIFMF